MTNAASVISVRLGGNSHAKEEALEFVRASGVFADVVGENEESFLNWDVGVQTRRVFAVHTTRNYFSALGVPVALGRGILPDDPNEVVVVLAHDFWQKYLGADSAVLGHALRLDGRVETVVGVLLPNHRTLIGFGFSPELYVPSYPNDIVLAMYARLKPGMSIEQARAGLATVASRMDAHFHEPFRYAGDIDVSPMAGMARLRFQRQLLSIGLFFGLLLTVVGLVLLIACMMSPLLARGMARRQEFAIRLSIGASRRRLLQQLPVESLLLALGGAACGLLIRQVLSILVERVNLPLPLPIRLHLDFDWRITLYAAALTTVVTLACGLLPAWRSVRQSIAPDLRRESRLRLRRALVAAQIALSVVVLAAGCVFLRNLLRFGNQISPGFDVRNTLRAEVHLEPAAYRSNERKRAYVAEVRRTLAALPGVEGVAAAQIVPFTDSQGRGGEIRFQDTGEQVHANVQYNAVSPEFFRVMSIPVLRAEHSSPRKANPATRVVVVNRTFVRQYLGNRDPIGLAFRWSDRVTFTIVGVVEGTRNLTIGEDDKPQLYEHLAQIEATQRPSSC